MLPPGRKTTTWIVASSIPGPGTNLSPKAESQYESDGLGPLWRLLGKRKSEGDRAQAALSRVRRAGIHLPFGLGGNGGATPPNTATVALCQIEKATGELVALSGFRRDRRLTPETNSVVRAIAALLGKTLYFAIAGL